MKIFEYISCGNLIWFVFFFIFPIGLAFNVNLDAPLTDSFHEGEYLGNFQVIKNYYAGLSSFPVLIHGAMDYLPSLLAYIIAGPDHIVVWTRFLNVLAVAVCWVLYLDFSRVVLRDRSDKCVWGLVFFLLFIWMTVAAGDDAVHKQQAFVGTRDLFFLLGFWTGARALYCRRVSSAYAFFIASGLFSGLSLYWSYDRGIMSAIFVICSAAALFYQRKRSYAMILVLAYVIALMLISRSMILGSLLENCSNIIYWVKNTEDVWFLSLKHKLPALPGALAMAVFAFIVIIHAVKKISQQRSRKTLPLVLSLIFIQVIFLTKLYSLPGFPTTYYFIWPAFLLLILTPPKSELLIKVNESLAQLLAYINPVTGIFLREDKKVLLSMSVLLLILFSNAILTFPSMFVKLARPVSDQKLVDSKHYGYDALAEYEFECVFQWSNEGIFSILSKKPYCTKYGYGIYISKVNEASALNELKKNPPGLIVYDSPYWSMKIYGRHMRDRLPAIDSFIKENYVFHNTETGYVFATPK